VFNQELDSELFTMRGMNIPAGTAVLEVPSPGGISKIWDGADLALVGTRVHPSGGNGPGMHARGIFACALLFAIAATAAMVYALRRTSP